MVQKYNRGDENAVIVVVMVVVVLVFHRANRNGAENELTSLTTICSNMKMNSEAQ